MTCPQDLLEKKVSELERESEEELREASELRAALERKEQELREAREALAVAAADQQGDSSIMAEVASGPTSLGEDAITAVSNEISLLAKETDVRNL